jgi:hypothetical protein
MALAQAWDRYSSLCQNHRLESQDELEKRTGLRTIVRSSHVKTETRVKRLCED